MRSQLEHRPAGKLSPLGAARGGEAVADETAHEVNVTEPALPHRLEDGAETGVVAPHEAALHEEFFLARESNHGTGVGEGGGAGFFKMDVFAGAEREEGMRGVVADFGFDGDDLCAGEELFLRNHRGTELDADFTTGRRGIADADEIDCPSE